MTSVRSFAEAAAMVLELPLDRLLFGTEPIRSVEMRITGVDVSRLEQLTGWKPDPDLVRGSRRAVIFETALARDSPDMPAPSTWRFGAKSLPFLRLGRLDSANTRSARLDVRTQIAPPTNGESSAESRQESAHLSLVMPCYNEEAIVAQTIRRLLQAFERAEIPIELITVDNGSRDRTLAILRELSGKHRQIVVVRVAENIG